MIWDESSFMLIASVDRVIQARDIHLCALFYLLIELFSHTLDVIVKYDRWGSFVIRSMIFFFFFSRRVRVRIDRVKLAAYDETNESRFDEHVISANQGEPMITKKITVVKIASCHSSLFLLRRSRQTHHQW
jgi:hypothetical protein